MTLSKTCCISLAIGIITTLGSTLAVHAATLAENSLLHYKRANHFVRTGLHDHAVNEYKTAYRLNPNSAVGKYSLQALAHYGFSAQDMQAAAASQSLQPPAIAQNPIAQQAEEFKRRSAQTTRARIDSRTKHIAGKIRTIDSNKRAAINNIVNNPSYRTAFVPGGYYPYGYGFGGGFYNPGTFVRQVDPVATQARINAVKEDAEARKKRLSDRNEAKAIQLKETHQKKALLIDETARNLQTQMYGKGVKLNPQGSNLYVRQYR